MKEFHQSSLRTTVTPYIHIIGNHLFEFHEFYDRCDYNMQGVEINNELSEDESDTDDRNTHLRNDEKENEDESEEQIDSSVIEIEEEDEIESLVWAPEKKI